MNKTSLKDSGERQTFETGALREPPSDKLRYDLIPPECLERMAIHYREGAKKYGDRNWEKGLPLITTYASLFRHVMDWARGDRSEDHLAAIVWNAFTLMFTEKRIITKKFPDTLDDRPEYMKP